MRWLWVAGALVLAVLAVGVVLMSAEGDIAPSDSVTTTAMAPPSSEQTSVHEPIGSGGEPASATAELPDRLPPAAAGDPPEAPANPPNGHGGAKVLSYFQQSITTLDTKRAFGFVLLPRAAVTEEEKRSHKAFCETVLASMDYMAPGAIAASTPSKVLATYWPLVIGRDAVEIAAAFSARDCTSLIAWYDHALARKLATSAGVAELSGPLLITWPSGDDAGAVRDPLIVDFSKADHARATKALQYWFRQLKNRPHLWTNRIREGTIRAELADAVNDTAGVMLAVMSGKWESLKTVATP